MKSISVVIPVFNEKENIKPLYKELNEVSKKLSFSFEFIFVDDGSADGSRTILGKIKRSDRRVKIISFTKNFGQTAAFDAGIKEAKGEVIVTMDADLQNDPADILPLLQKLSEGFDIVCGWRKKRMDSLEKKIFSYLGNFLRKSLTGETIHDSGCSLRVYRREVFADIDLYGEMHRFIPAILTLKGYRISELPILHRARSYGKSKYHLSRVLKGFFDLLFIVFLLRFSSRPLHIFGTIGLVTSLAGVMFGGYLSFIKIFYGATLSNRPLLILSVLLVILGTQFFIFGILAEILIRIYYKTHGVRPYTIDVGKISNRKTQMSNPNLKS